MKIALLLAVILLFAMTISLAWGAQKPDEPKMPVFSAKDREVIETYYKHILGNIAPGTLDRSGFQFEIEHALVAGSRVPMQVEKDLQQLPRNIESQLTQITSEYERYRLGRHVLLVRKPDLVIADIIKNVAVK
jgi:hypothetical protein